jgi:hypothetical protein
MARTSNEWAAAAVGHDVNFTQVCDNLYRRMCRGPTSEGSLEREDEQEGPKWVTLLRTVGGEDWGGIVRCALDESARWSAIHPGEERWQGGGILMSSVKDGPVPHTVEGLLAVQREETGKVVCSCIEQWPKVTKQLRL